MDIKVVRIEEDIIIAGLSIGSSAKTLEDFNNDMDKLHNDLLRSGKMELLNNITNNNHEYYAVTWYGAGVPDDKDFIWLLGQKINKEVDGLENKTIPKGEYAVSKFPPKYDAIKAWTDLYAEIPETGYNPIEDNNIAFTYYPNGLDGDTEIWALVEKV